MRLILERLTYQKDSKGSSMIQIQGIPIDPEKARNIVSCDLSHRAHLICVNFHPPLADIIFLFNTEEERDEIFNNIQIQQEAI